MSIRIPIARVLALSSPLLFVAGSSWAQASSPPAREVFQHLTRSCGGFAGTPCPKGQLCVDDPSDDCDPERGGADCIGICVKESECKPASCDYNNPRRKYVSKSPSSARPSGSSANRATKRSSTTAAAAASSCAESRRKGLHGSERGMIGDAR
ncbi:hypothetical protein F0U61_44360 [Archangium violaceum]|nr:hypothetical protein F0U61_44360 [Archangium violaceum]